MKYTPKPKRAFPEMGGTPKSSMFIAFSMINIHFGDSPFMETLTQLFVHHLPRKKGNASAPSF
jgi:hypothetical protein